MGAKIPCYFSAHGRRRTALACRAGPAAAASFGLPRLLTGRLNPRLFKGLGLLIGKSPVFPFPEARFVLKCQRAALATFELTPFSPATKIFALVGLHREFNIMSVLSMRRLAARGPQPRAAREGGSIQLQCALDAHGEIARSAVAWSHDGIRESRGLRRAASKSLHLDRRRLQHELGHSRLSRRRRSMEAARAGDLSGLHGRRGDAPALLGAQPYRMATHSPRPAERCASRLGPARGHGQGARSF